MAEMDRYGEECMLLKNGVLLGKKSALHKDMPYLDSSDLLRAKERIEFANYAVDSLKTPALLPNKH